MGHLDNAAHGHRMNPETGSWETFEDNAWQLATPEEFADLVFLFSTQPDLFTTSATGATVAVGDTVAGGAVAGGGDTGIKTILEQIAGIDTGGSFQAVRDPEGNLLKFNRRTGDYDVLIEKGPTSPTRRFVTSPTTGNWYLFNEETLQLTLIDAPDPEQLAGFGTKGEALRAGKAGGIDNPTVWVDDDGRFHFDIPEPTEVPTDFRLRSQARDAALESGLEKDEIELFIKNNRWSFTKKEVEVPTDFRSTFEAWNAAIESGLPADDIELFIENNRWNFTQKKAEAAAPQSFFTEIDPATGKLLLINRNTGEITDASDAPDPEEPFVAQKPEEISHFDQNFLFNPNTGTFERVAPTFDAQFLDQSLGLFQQPSGQVSQFRTTPQVPNIDDIITQALIDGEIDKAMAFDDFRDRPTALETFQTAMAFARSPADQVLVSAIARGQVPVTQEFDPTRPQRIGPQPDFLIRAFNEFQQRTMAGEPPTPAEQKEFQARFTAGTSLQDALTQSQIDLNNAKAQGVIDKSAAEVASIEAKAAADAAKAEAEAAAAATAATAAEQEAADAAAAAATAAEQEAAAAAAAAEQEAVDVVDGVDEVDGADVVDEPDLTIGEDSAYPTFADLEASGIVPSTGPQVSAGVQGANAVVADLGADTSASMQESRQDFRQLELSPSGEAPGMALDPRSQDKKPFKRQPIFGFAGGGYPKGAAIVGEKGPELALFPRGTKILPLGRMSKRKARDIKRKGVRGMQAGGTISLLPFGVQQLQAGAAIEPSRGRLLRAANLALPSAQGFQNLTPESREVFIDQARLAGIPMGALEQELQTARPAGRRLPLGNIRGLNFAGIR
jgi:hypothetical protein